MEKIRYVLLKGLLAIFAALPLCVHHLNARFLAFLIGKVFRYRHKVVMSNLSRCFPEKSREELNVICNKFYRHFADVLVEAIWFGGCRNPERLRRAHIMEIVNPEELERLYNIAPSVAVMYSHCGNWELYGGIENYNYSGKPLSVREDNFVVVYRKLTSKVWDRIMKGNRSAPLKDREHYEGYVESKDIIRYVYNNRDKKKFYNANTDQRPYFRNPNDLQVKFFFDTVTTMSGMASVAHKFGMAVCFLKMPVLSRGHYALEYVTICDDASKMSVEEIMDRYYRMLEEEIRLQPENYLWSHNRWWKYWD